MTNQFTYSILQYRHSLIVGESVNIGILFSFPGDNKVQFVTGDTKRVKCLYPDFDSSIINQLAKNINSKVSQIQLNDDLFLNKSNLSIKEYINSILIEDSSSLQFTEPFTSVKPFDIAEKIIDEFSKNLLPQGEQDREEIRHNENFILRKYTDSLTKKVRKVKLEHRLRYNLPIRSNKVELNFEIAWQNNNYSHFVKPISFDLKEAVHIRDKSVRFWGYFTRLNEYAKANKVLFDLLIAKPQDQNLKPEYENALDLLSETVAPKTIITEDEYEQYSDETIRSIDIEVI